jgi:hypothetical protein
MKQFARINQVLGVDELVIEDGGSWLNGTSSTCLRKG